jgi:hypothetical protein
MAKKLAIKNWYKDLELIIKWTLKKE